jgi:SAM-dependent methyltransferase
MALSLAQWHKRYQQQAKWTENLRNYLYTRVGIHNLKDILDVGCGTGVILGELSQLTSASIFGLDISHNPLRMAHETNSSFLLSIGDAHQLPFSDNSFDCCLCHFLLLWVNDPNYVTSEMVRVTRRGGLVMALAEPDYGGRIDFPPQLTQVGQWQIEALKKQGANPNIGRELGAIFSVAGLHNIEVGVLGGQWGENFQKSDFDLELEVIKSDLNSINKYDNQISELITLDEISRKNKQRILFVPTFYAVGEVLD